MSITNVLVGNIFVLTLSGLMSFSCLASLENPWDTYEDYNEASPVSSPYSVGEIQQVEFNIGPYSHLTEQELLGVQIACSKSKTRCVEKVRTDSGAWKCTKHTKVSSTSETDYPRVASLGDSTAVVPVKVSFEYGEDSLCYPMRGTERLVALPLPAEVAKDLCGEMPEDSAYHDIFARQRQIRNLSRLPPFMLSLSLVSS